MSDIGILLATTAGLWLVLTCIVLGRNLLEFKSLPKVHATSPLRISVCVPARNEEAGIGRCVASILNQPHNLHEVLVLDDGSTDGTADILGGFESPRLRVMRGIPKPDGWLGKPWACRQLSDAATGDILLFLDADTWLDPDSLAKLAGEMDRTRAGLLTVWPMQQLGSWSERLVVPMVYHALLTLLPVRYVDNDPRWMPAGLRPTFRPLFAAACGQFMAFRRETYDRIGGHDAVRSAVVDDVEMAKAVKRAGGRVVMAHGLGTVSCRMYRSHREVFNGFRKNFLAGFGNNIPFFLLSAGLHIWVYLLPIAAMAVGWIPVGTGTALVMVPIVQRLLIAWWFQWPRLDSLLHPIGVAWFQALALRVLADRLSGRKILWKGRPV